MFNVRKVRELQDPKAFPCHLAETDLISRLPQKFMRFSGLLAKARTRSFKKNDLGFACNIIAKLASFEGMNTGYYCKFKKSMQVPGNGNDGFYLVKGCVITCRDGELEDVVKNIENNFFDKYKIRIKLELNGNSQNRESFLANSKI